MKKFFSFLILAVFVPNICFAALTAEFTLNGNSTDSISGISGTSFGNVKYGKGFLNDAVYLDGDGDYIDYGKGFNLGKDFTFNVWIKPDKENLQREDAAIFCKYETNGYGPYDFYISNNRPAFWISTGKGKDSYQEHISNTKLNPEQWYMLTYTYSYEKQQLTIYINGEYDNSFSCVPVTQNDDKVTVGRQALMFPPYSNLQYKGWIDEIQIYDETLTADYIKALYNRYVSIANLPTEVNYEKNTINFYYGPGEDYKNIGTIDKKNIRKIIKFENGWLEVEVSGIRGYISEKFAPELLTNDVPRTTTNISQNVTLYPQILFVNFPIKLYDEVTIYKSPENTSSPKKIAAGKTVKLLCIEKNIYSEYAQIEAVENNQKFRGYALTNDLFSFDNPLKEFENVKKSNAVINYEGINYYSSTGGESGNQLDNQWKKVEEKTIQKVKFDWVAGITNVISSNSDMSDEVARASGGEYGQYRFYDQKHNRYQNVNLENTDAVNKLNLASTLMEAGVNFLAGANKSIAFKINLLQCSGENKIVIRTGRPFEMELGLAGKEDTLGGLLIKKDSTNLFTDAEDRAIKSAYPDLRKDKKYSMTMTFSNDFNDNPYGYYIIFDKNLNAYSIPIIHNGTSFKVYSEHKFIFDAVFDYGKSLAPLDDKSTEILKKLLEENGFNFSGMIVTKNKNIPSDAFAYNGHHYYVFAGVNTWEDAKKYCESLGGHLAVINDKAENDALYGYITSRGHKTAYFGLSDSTQEGNWKWLDDSVNYYNWCKGEPNGGRGENYAEFYYKFTDGTWNDGNFGHGTQNDSKNFICEWDY